MRSSSTTGHFAQRFFSRIFKSRSSKQLQLSGVEPSGTDLNGAPFVITLSVPGVLVENKFPANYVLRGSECLLHFAAHGLSLYLRLELVAPTVQAGQTGQTGRHVNVEPQFELAFYDAKHRDVLCVVSSDVRDQVGGATFAHVAAQPMFQAIRRIFKDAASPKVTEQSAQLVKTQKIGFSTPAVCAIAALVFTSTVLFFSGANNPPAGASMVARNAAAANTALPPAQPALSALVAPSSAELVGSSMSSVAAPSVATSQGDQLNDVEKQILSKVVAESGIELAAGGKPFVIFSDPNCPSCRQLEAQLSTMDKSLSPVVVPVSFQRNSAEAVSWILCSSNVTQAWKIAVTAERGVVGEGSCVKGKAQAEANNAAFTALKFDRTPTIITSSGKVAVGVKDFDGLAKWIKANS